MLWLPMIAGAIVAVAICYASQRARRFALVGLLIGTSCTLSARRLLPPPHDISSLVRNQPAPDGPIRGAPAALEGWVASVPAHTDFTTSFAFECDAHADGPQHGLGGYVAIKTNVPYEFKVGQRLRLEVPLKEVLTPGNEGQISRQYRQVEQSAWCQAFIDNSRQIAWLGKSSRYPVQQWLARGRAGLMRRFRSSFAGADPGSHHPYPTHMAQLMTAMTCGEDSLSRPLPALTRDTFRAAGLSHILVASGAQVVALGTLLICAGRLLGLRRWALVALMLPVALSYAGLAGGGPSIGRATIVGLLGVWALTQGREVDGLSLWSLAVAMLLLLDPIQLFSISFQLTFAAAWGLLAVAPVLRGQFSRWFGSGVLTDMAALTGGAQLATTPLLLAHFGQISLVSFVVNLVAVPLAGMLLWCSMAGLVLPFLHGVNFLLTYAINGIALAAAAIPYGWGTVPQPAGAAVAGLYLLICGIVVWMSWNIAGLAQELRAMLCDWWIARFAAFEPPRPQTLAVAIVALVALFAVFKTFDKRSDLLRVTLLDVGQGESIVIRSPAGRTVIIDGGSTSLLGNEAAAQAVILPYLQAKGVRQIDALVVTHADADHCNALAEVLREVPVNLVIDGGIATNDREGQYQNFKDEAARLRVETHAAAAGQSLDLGDGARLTLLGPSEPRLEGDDNNNCAVARLDFGTTSMLLTGDIESEAEKRLLESGADLHCDVLKVAHHGSHTSTTEEFLARAAPRAAVLSCGRSNKYHHPAPAIIKRLRDRKIPVYRTDSDGAVEASSDGTQFWIESYRQNH